MRVFKDKMTYSLEDLKKQCEEITAKSPAEAEDGLYRFGQALKKPGLSIISEIKKASPSKGIISEDFPFLKIAGDYEKAGADAISCLTEPNWFLGSDDIFAAVRAYTKLPMIRKDFVVDEYQLYQAKTLGADAVLLICALLDTETIRYYLGICEQLQMDALVETHDADEIRSAVEAGARIIGVNNRNLKDFSVDFSNAEKLRELIPETCVFVAESGVKGPEDAARLQEIGADAILVGEALMRAENKQAMIREMKGDTTEAAGAASPGNGEAPDAASSENNKVLTGGAASGQTGSSNNENLNEIKTGEEECQKSKFAESEEKQTSGILTKLCRTMRDLFSGR